MHEICFMQIIPKDKESFPPMHNGVMPRSKMGPGTERFLQRKKLSCYAKNLLFQLFLDLGDLIPDAGGLFKFHVSRRGPHRLFQIRQEVTFVLKDNLFHGR